MNEDDLQYYAIDAHQVLNVMQSTINNVNIIVLERAYKTHQRVDDMFMGIRYVVMR